MDGKEGVDFLTCPFCKKKLVCISKNHYQKHGFESAKEFKKASGLKYLRAEVVRRKQSRFLSERNPTRGKKRSAEEKALMSQNRKGKGLGVSGKYVRTPEIRDKISKGVTDFHLKMGVSGEGYTSLRGRAEWVYTSLLDKKVFVRSSWEKKLLWVLEHYPQVEYFEYEPFAIEYQFEGQTRRYIPDFYVCFEGKIEEVWEIKPKWLVGDPKNQAKWEALKAYAKERGWHARIVTEDNIHKMMSGTIYDQITGGLEYENLGKRGER